MKQYLILLSVLACYNRSFAQTYQWTWVSGSNSSSQGSISNTKGQSSTANVAGARTSAASWLDKSGNFWVFGGDAEWISPAGSGDLSDLWKYNPSTNEWTWVSGDAFFNQPAVYGTKGVPSTANHPGARTLSASWIDKDGNLWLFGGGSGVFGANATTCMNDLWKFNPSTNEWTWMGGSNLPNQHAIYGIKGTPSTGNTPPALTRDMCWTDHNGMFWLYGGTSNTGDAKDDLWKYNPSTNEWTWMRGNHAPMNFPDYGAVYGTKKIPSPSNSPGLRVDATGWVDAGNNLWLFGGGPGVNMLNDLWKYDPVLNEWTWVNGDNNFFGVSVTGTKGVPAPGNQPSCRYASLGLTDLQGQFWLFGGMGMGNDPVLGDFGLMNDLWKYDPAADEWAWMSGDPYPRATAVYGSKGVPDPGNKPGGRIYASGWVDAGDRLWLFGGFGNGSATSTFVGNDVWGYAVLTKISITSLSASAIGTCSGMDINFSAFGPFTSANKFIAQLSDPAGSFASPVNIGSIATATGGTIKAVIPPNTGLGSGYRVRVVATDPSIVGPDNGSDVTISKQQLSLAGNAPLCPNSIIQLNAHSGFSSYLWQDGSTDSILSVSQTGTYSVTVIDGCGNSLSAQVSVVAAPPPPTVFLPGDTVICSFDVLPVTALTRFKTYSWSTGENTSHITIAHPGVYWLQATDDNNCITRDTIEVDQKDCLEGFFMPSAFSPNGDGKNDILRPKLYGNVRQMHFIVFDRWGQKVFETTEKDKGWDGRLPSGANATGTFIWACEYQFEGQPLRRGQGTVIAVR